MNENSKLTVVSDDIQALLVVTGVEISNSVEILYEKMKKSSDAILECTKINELMGASEHLSGLKNHLKELQTSSLLPIPFVNWVQKSWRTSEIAIKGMIKRRQTIKATLEEKKAQYEIKRKALMSDIEKIRENCKETIVTSTKIEEAICKFNFEISLLSKQLGTEIELSEEEIKKIRYGIRVREVAVADLSGNKVINESSAIILATQIEEREALFTKMGSIRPSLDALLSQQLVALITQAPVRAALREIQETADVIRELAIENSLMAKQDAVLTAKIVGDPIIDAETINKVTENIVAMIEETKLEIDKSVVKQRGIIEAAKIASQKLKIAMTLNK